MIATEPDMFVNIAETLVARYPQAPGFKRPGTSAQAAQQMQPQAGTLRAAVLAVLRQKPYTADEVATAIGKSILAVRPRLSELSASGRILETSERRRNASGKLAAVWRAT